MYERDPYAEAHRKGPGFGLFVVWVVTCVLATAAGETASNFIDGYIAREGALAWLNFIVTGTAIGAIIGLAQGTVLVSYLGLRGMIEWMLATVVGRVARILVLAVLVDLAAGISLKGNFFLALVAGTLIFGSIGAMGGVVLGTAQSFVLERWVMHPRWWVLANIGASAIVLGVGYWLPYSDSGEPTLRVFNGLVTGIVTGIALSDLLKEPTSGQGWWLTWKRERPVKASIDAGTQPSAEALLEEMRAGRRP
jgi:hypothetical protein